jgi:DNA-binding winged helix-turn-helix (wHTH) protein
MKYLPLDVKQQTINQLSKVIKVANSSGTFLIIIREVRGQVISHENIVFNLS